MSFILPTPPEPCLHPRTCISDGIDSMAEAPYDAGDFWWVKYCEDCGDELDEGDGYNHPHHAEKRGWYRR